MNLSLRRLAWALPLAGLLVACSTGGGGGGGTFDPYPDATPLTLSTNDQPALTAVAPNRSNVTIEAGESRVFRVRPSEATRQAVYFLVDEVDGFANVIVQDRSANAIASSAFPSVFERGTGALSLTRQGTADPQAISPDRQSDCANPCVILSGSDLDAARYFIVEAGSEEVTVDVYAFSRDFDDLGEPENDSRTSTDETLVHSDFQVEGTAGALETLGDRDWYEVGNSGCLTVDPAEEVSTWITVHDAGGTEIDGTSRQFSPGDDVSETNVEVFPGEFVLVTTVEDEAGDAFASTYTLWIDDCP